jgi:hypothetical protein
MAALAGVADETRQAAWQDGLDLLATLAGLKPLCLIGRGFVDPAWHTSLCRVAAAFGIDALEAVHLLPAAAPGFFPAWYVAAAARRRVAPATYLCRDDAMRGRAAALASQQRVASEDEAALLGYPPCCVAQHHRQALAFETLVFDMTARLAQGDAEKMARLVEAGVEPLFATADEWRRYERVTVVRPAPYTSVNMCDACAADPASPAAVLSRRYQQLAADVGYAPRT